MWIFCKGCLHHYPYLPLKRVNRYLPSQVLNIMENFCLLEFQQDVYIRAQHHQCLVYDRQQKVRNKWERNRNTCLWEWPCLLPLHGQDPHNLQDLCNKRFRSCLPKSHQHTLLKLLAVGLFDRVYSSRPWRIHAEYAKSIQRQNIPRLRLLKQVSFQFIRNRLIETLILWDSTIEQWLISFLWKFYWYFE